jgi:ribonuclease III
MKKKTKPQKVAAGHQPLQSALGHNFSKPELLQLALSHSSFAHESAAESGEQPRDNEQLEFLGDAVLGFVTSRALYDRYTEYSEGQLSKTRAHLVSARHLVKVANLLSLGSYLRLGRGEERSGGRSKSALLVDALEAIIAALYLDGGLEAAQRFVLETIIEPELKVLEKDPSGNMTDQKSALQEWLQATTGQQPAYRVVQEAGPDHRKVFTVELRLTGEMSGGDGRGVTHVCRAQGPTKKAAEQKVAQDALKFLQRHSKGLNPSK